MRIYTKEWFNQKDKTTLDLMNAHGAYNRSCVNLNVPEKLKKDLHLHDEVIKRILFDKGDLIISFAPSNAIYNVIECHFTQVTLRTYDNILSGDFWLYEEIYPENDKYELHILLCDRDENPKELIFVFKDVFFKYDINKENIQKELEKWLKHKTEK